MRTRVVLESGAKRTFASALDWPGWARSGRSVEDALQALVAAAPRYAGVARRAGVTYHPPTSTAELEPVERLPGGGGTDFGVPGAAAAAEDAELDASELTRFCELLRAAWAELDAVAASARGHELRKGPRGGGRELDAVLEHVREAEVAYLGQLGSRPPPVPDAAAVRSAFVDTLEARVAGRPLPNPRRTKSPWSPRYAVRRAAWHVLDHAWEIEDRAEPPLTTTG